MKRLALGLLLIPAIVAGLLAMHFLAMPGMSHSEQSHGMVMTTEPMPMSESGSSTITECDGTCGSELDMLGMACILALLLTALLLIVHLVLQRWESLVRAMRALVSRAVAAAPPRPPSLLLLSISRT